MGLLALLFVAYVLPVVVALALLVAATAVERPGARHLAVHTVVPALLLGWLHRLGGPPHAFWAAAAMSALALAVLARRGTGRPRAGSTATRG